MIYYYQDQSYPICIQRKNNKNTYIRVLEDLSIQVTTSYFMRDKQIEKLIVQHQPVIDKMLFRAIMKRAQLEEFYYLGQKYDIIILPTISEVSIIENKIYTRDDVMLQRWYRKEMKRLFQKRLDVLYSQFVEDIPYPSLKIRKMKTRWGVCNRKNISVTLNSMLLRYSIEELDYVIIHELSHLVHFDHSRAFWNLVEKYCPDYKARRKVLRE